jgi:MoaA/NifB/PqqE/SkfB family radical SAM enzyme
MFHEIDCKFHEYFVRDNPKEGLKQVFMYVINKCNLDCPQCIYKPDNLFTIGDREIPFETAKRLLSDFYEMGARKLTLLGGEPTLYGSESDNLHSVCDLVAEAKKLGYEYVRMDTNGVFEPHILDDDNLKQIDEISFSIDGYDSATNDVIRGEGSFVKATKNIEKAIVLGYTVDITCCIHNDLLDETDDGEFVLEKFIYLAEKIKINRVNFHALVKDGTQIDTWTGDLQVSVEKWLKAYKRITENIKNGKYKKGNNEVKIRIPETFIRKEQFMSNPGYYGFCPAKLGERVLVHPNGVIRICSGLLCTAYCIADYHDNKIVWNDRMTNELRDHKLYELTPCTNRSKKDFGEYYPLCFSFKSGQDEYVYKELLNWDENNDK